MIRLGLITLITIIIFSAILSPVIIDGESMEPTYRDSSLTLINRLSYAFKPPARGEIVAIKLAGRRLMFLKRIIGLPGETVAIRDGWVLINDTPLVEPYLISPRPWNLPARVLTTEEYFVIGDNRRQPLEQHLFGRVYGQQIVGRVLW